MLDNVNDPEPAVVTYPDGIGTYTMLLANGPHVGLPFVFVTGIPTSQRQRFTEYFEEVWTRFLERPVSPVVAPVVVRGSRIFAEPDRDKNGLTLILSQDVRNLAALAEEFAELHRPWPDAPVMRLAVMPPPVTLSESGARGMH